MGIKGIYAQIGPGERIALSKLAVKHLEKTGCPLRIAVDVAIWSFQTQSGKGGSNPALRTLYYRLVKLLSLSIQPIFVFDGPNKPPFKRSARTSQNTSSLSNFLTKQLLNLFGFPFHMAPGEAEAECALLQKEGIVDAVLSEDVDTLMFGCGLSLRSWTSEGTRGNKTPTHVNMYAAEATKAGSSGLDSDGMILVALMSGGDYVPAGIPACGIKIACQAAKAGFGRDLHRLSGQDYNGLAEWRERLQHELRTNESGFFRVKHKAIVVPDIFPDKAILGYYTHPAVSSLEKLNQLAKDTIWEPTIDLPGLRRFVAEAFDWLNLPGATKFVRGLAPALLVQQLRQRGDSEFEGDLKARELYESKLVSQICGRRCHIITDGTPELRVAYVPAEIVGLDLTLEAADQGLRNPSGSEAETSEPATSRSRSPSKRTTYDPMDLEKIWIMESYVKCGAPLLVETWEEKMAFPKRCAPKKPAPKKASQQIISGGMKAGALDPFVKTGKPSLQRRIADKTPNLPPEFLAPFMADVHVVRSPRKVQAHNKTKVKTLTPQKPTTYQKHTPKASSRKNCSKTALVFSSPDQSQSNPWTLSKRPSDTFDYKVSPKIRYSALGIYGSPNNPEQYVEISSREDDEGQEKSTLSPKSPKLKRHSRSPSPNFEADSVVDLSTPSPKKKRTPGKLASSEPRQHQETARSSIILEDTQVEMDNYRSVDAKPLTPQRTNRILDFGLATSPSVIKPPSSSSSLQSLRELLSPTAQAVDKPILTYPAVLSKPVSSPPRARKGFIALRESLEGTWKNLQPWDAESGAIMYSDVEILDLTKT